MEMATINVMEAIEKEEVILDWMSFNFIYKKNWRFSEVKRKVSFNYYFCFQNLFYPKTLK